MQEWEFAEVTWNRSAGIAMPGQEAKDESSGSAVFSGEHESLDIAEGEFWDTVHRLGQVGWEMVGTRGDRVVHATGAMVTAVYVFKRPVE